MLGTSYRAASEGTDRLVVMGKAGHSIEGGESLLSLNFVLTFIIFSISDALVFTLIFFFQSVAMHFFSNCFTVTAFFHSTFSDFFSSLSTMFI